MLTKKQKKECDKLVQSLVYGFEIPMMKITAIYREAEKLFVANNLNKDTFKNVVLANGGKEA